MHLAVGSYAEAVRLLIAPARFDVFAAAPSADPFPIFSYAGAVRHFTDGPFAYASTSSRSEEKSPSVAAIVPANVAEIGWFKLELGDAVLEWADALYRSNQPESIMRARELYKAVLFLHGDDPMISPNWPRASCRCRWIFARLTFQRNPAVDGQCSRARLGFIQIDDRRNFYGVPASHVPPVPSYRVLKEAADRFAAGARAAQIGTLGYMQQLDELTVSEMTARTMVAKASSAIVIAQEQQQIAQVSVGEAQKQVERRQRPDRGQEAEIADKESFFEQSEDFAAGMKDSVSKLADVAFSGREDAGAASAQKLSTAGDIVSLGMKVGTASSVTGGGASALAGAAGTAGIFGAFLYAGVSSISAMADAIAERAGKLSQLEKVALPAAKALVTLKQRDVTIARLSTTMPAPTGSWEATF